jgi:hypothetical protein
MAFPWTSIIGLGKPTPHSDGNNPEPRNLQDGLWQIGTQACHILVHANNNNISTYENDEDKRSECIRSLVEVATSDRTTKQDQQMVMLIPHTSSRLAPTKRSKRSKLNVSMLLLLLLLLFLLFSQVFPRTFPLEPMVNPTTQASSF